MKEYPKQYEDVFSAEKMYERLRLSKLSFDKDITIPEYIEKFKKILDDFQLMMFDFLVKFYWLSSRFHFYGHKYERRGGTPYVLRMNFPKFFRKYLNHDHRLINRTIFGIIINYLEDIFPDFHDKNPFIDPYPYPYKHMSFECLTLIYKIPERMELLAVGEREKMSYIQFIDYCLNYTQCRNEENEDKYHLRLTHNSMFYFYKYEQRHEQQRQINRRKRRAKIKKAKTDNIC